MFGFFRIRNKKKGFKVYAPVSGKIVNFERLNDGVFSEGVLGDGIAIIPNENDFYSPLNDANLIMVFKTGHLFATKKDSYNYEILVHIGLETFTITNNIFKKLKKEKEIVSTSDKIINVKLEELKKLKKDVITPIFVSRESIDNSPNSKIEFNKKNGENVLHGELLFTIY